MGTDSALREKLISLISCAENCVTALSTPTSLCLKLGQQ